MSAQRCMSLSLQALLSVALVFCSSAVRAECIETGPSGPERPQMVESFPGRGVSGYTSTLHVVVSHGRGERVLPHGLELQRESDAARALNGAGFLLPDQDAGAGATLSSTDAEPTAGAAQAGRMRTTLDLPLVALPKEPGRHTLTLPPLPIVVARANGDVVTLCTRPHSLVVDDPTASTPHAVPKLNPPPRAQREEWVALERALSYGAAGVVLGAIALWLVRLWKRRPKIAPPPPPPRVPWEVALERLDEARHAGLLETQRFSDFFDRVNDAVRQYLGARFGFDGLESTTDETLTALGRLPHFSLPIGEVRGFLQHCDLVKFADLTPTHEECQRALVEAERVVRQTIPVLHDAPRSGSAESRS
jgi:hypothetical protein